MDFSFVFSLASFIVLLLSATASPFPAMDSASLSILTDQEALLSFKSLITSDPSGTISTWNDSSTVCEWSRVSCNKLRQRVFGLDLHGLGLIGSISPNLGNLSFLHFLYLQDNHFSGTLPDQLGHLFRLHFLNVSSNLIEGVIPNNISKCSKLEVLDLSGNMISGRVPPELELLSQLQVLKLGKNELMGTIPPSIGNLSSLATLDLGTNSLSGSIPSELGRLSKLNYLKLTINNLTGTVPPSLYNVSSLATFDLASNKLWGVIPSDVGFRLPNLLDFHFCFNKFTGPIPPSLNNLTRIQSLRMSNNFFVGTVPPGLGNLPDLVMYNIGFNRIVSSGNHGLEFITSLTNSTKLEFLSFDENLLEGVIPESVGNLSSSLSKLYMGQNRIYGSIPASIGHLTNLALLNVSHNSISGEIPQDIGQLKKLQMLSLAGNRISGEIPAALGNLSKLNKLELFGNDLEGNIPATFSKYENLLSLDLSSNKLNGNIPIELFTLTSLSSLLNISKNSLTGPLPQEVGSLENIVTIDISSNLLSGNIPDSIGKCRSLQDLSMSNNSFSGLIPNTISKVKGLQSLDLSSNQLSGSIPNDLEKLQALQFLNLSFNDLEGEIPEEGVFRNLSHVHLEGNSKLCRSSLCNRPHSSHRSLSKALRITILTSAIIILCLLLGLFWTFFLRRGSDAKVLTASDSFVGQHRMVSYVELFRATGNFDPGNLIGTGSFGSVYRGALRDGMTVAIKVLNLGIRGASKSFIAECEALRNVRHRNLVKLVTSCSSLDFANISFSALVYEFMSNGSLEDWIRGRRGVNDHALDVMERLDIAIDVASALDYLHNDCEPPVVHCDLKPSNVLLDEEMTAKVGDFGLARLLVGKPKDQDSISTTHGIKGSIGYIPPEYGFGAKPSTRGDVYSYGVMLLELLTGKSPTDASFTGDLSLEKWVRAAFPTRTMEVMDSALLLDEGKAISLEKQQECLVSIVRIGLSCSMESPEARVNMRDVLHQLTGIKSTLMKPHIGLKIG